jgi:WS/DGAT/MGAT family acyltransferase
MATSYLDPRSEVSAPAMPLFSPKTLLNRAISSDRCVALGSVALADLKTVKNALGLTVNDVVLAACSMALREYLRAHDDLPDAPLVAAVPVSLHGGDGDDATNAVSAMFVRLPVHLADPREQLELIRAEATEAKALHRSSSSSLLAEWAQYASPTWFAALVNLYSRFDLADSHAPLYNVVISNVRGPSFPLYCVGHRVARCHPLGPIFEGAAVNITVMSYLDTVQIGVLACPDSTPDVWSITTGFEEAVRTLVDEVAPSSRRRPADGTRRRSGSRRRKPAHK